MEAVVEALATSRVLVPVVAHEETEKDTALRARFAASGGAAPAHTDVPVSGTDSEPVTAQQEACHETEREASASLVTVETPDGRAALPIFSSVEQLHAWRSDARPVPHEGPRTAMAAVDEAAGVLVLDPGSARPVLVPRPAVWALARGVGWVPALADSAVTAEVVAALSGVRGVQRAEVVAGERAEIKVILAVVPGLPRAEVEAVAQDAARVLSQSVVVAERVDSVELALTTA